MPHIAVDGPAGAGKSTVARMLAAELGYLYVDTGAMYRALTYQALKTKTDLHNLQALAALAERTQMEMRGGKIYCDGEDVTSYLRTPEVSRYVSLVASSPVVREKMVQWQRAIAAHHSVVMDGRDIGSYVLPHADFKFFVTASLEERAKRRLQELRETGDSGLTLEDVRQELEARDKLDTTRAIAPLVRPPDAECIDTTSLTPRQVVERIIAATKRD